MLRQILPLNDEAILELKHLKLWILNLKYYYQMVLQMGQSIQEWTK